MYALRLCLAVWACCCLSGSGAWALPLVYRGQVHDSWVTLSIELLPGDSCTGLYYYENYRKDIALTGSYSMEGGRLYLREEGGGGWTGEWSGGTGRISGEWLHPDGRRYAFWLDALLPCAGKKSLDIQKIKAFQELLSLPLPRLRLPLELRAERRELRIDDPTASVLLPGNRPALPYTLARRYLFQQTRFSIAHYFNPTEKQYRSTPHRLLGLLRQTERWTALLFHLKDDNGWDEFEVFYVSVFDHEGKLLDELCLYAYYIIERTGELLSEKTGSTVLANHSVQLQSDKLSVRYGTDPATLKEYYQEKNTKTEGLYQLSREGRWEKKK